MHISDWSSDVCSSDLEPWGARAGSRDLHQTHIDQRLGIFDARSESDPAANHALKIALEHCRRGAEPNRIDEGQNVKLFQMLPLRDILGPRRIAFRSEEHTSELQSIMRISYAVFCLKKKKTHLTIH